MERLGPNFKMWRPRLANQVFQVIFGRIEEIGTLGLSKSHLQKGKMNVEVCDIRFGHIKM